MRGIALRKYNESFVDSDKSLKYDSINSRTLNQHEMTNH